MRADRLKLKHFRNHTDTEVNPAPHLNLITGPNGSGKTSLIDSLHYLCMSRSFVSTSDQYVVTHDETFFMIEGDFKGNIRSDFKVGCSYSKGEGKKVFINDSPLGRLSDLIGMVPVVVLSPEDQKLTGEGPVERRSFIDSFISQISNNYLRDLIEYRKIRKQRNKLLKEFKGPVSMLKNLLEPWDVQLVNTGARIVKMRSDVLLQFKRYLSLQYEKISGLKLKPDLEYQTFCRDLSSVENITKEYSKILENSLEKEIEREQTIAGPHRDEIIFYLDEMELRKYGSQGQHRLFAISLKMAQLFYYSDELDELPVMLLDDVFGNLDQHKTDILIETLIDHPGQIFVTSASEKPFSKFPFANNKVNAWFVIDNGSVIKRE
ncbi:MAG: DNA replication/repair protein RecF [Balneolaceae bacterium]